MVLFPLLSLLSNLKAQSVCIQQVSKNVEVQFAIPELEAGIATTQEVTALTLTLGAGPLSYYVHLFL